MKIKSNNGYSNTNQEQYPPTPDSAESQSHGPWKVTTTPGLERLTRIHLRYWKLRSVFDRKVSNIKFSYMKLLQRVYNASPSLAFILSEPAQLLRRTIPHIAGRKKNFTMYGINTGEPSSQDEVFRPVILVHGDKANQGCWTQLGKALMKDGGGDVYTLNLPANLEDRPEALLDKIKEVAQKTPKGQPLCIDLVGHSRGVETIIEALSQLPENIYVNCCYLLGLPEDNINMHFDAFSKAKEKKNEIVQFHGRYDLLEDYNAFSPDANLDGSNDVHVAECGHMGLLSNRKVIKKIVEKRKQSLQQAKKI
ncbi:hypothetical protein [Kistimonas scapharcae]